MSASEPTTTRAAPRVIHMPPPRFKTMRPAGLMLLAGTLVALGILFASVVPSPGNWITLAAALLGAATVPFHRWYGESGHLKARTQFFRKHPECEADPSVAVLDDIARDTRSKATLFLERLSATQGQAPACAQIVCVAQIDPPAASDIRFEPYVITATELLWRRLLFLPVALALLTIWLLQVVHVIPGRVFNLGSFTYFLALGLGTGVAWVWKTGLRPTYVRLAPGIVQVIEYRLRRQKPLIRSYPMQAGTVVVFKGEKQNVTVTLLRGEQRDVLPFAAMRKRAEKLERLWWALLSTAPTPPLSDEDLLG